MINTVESNLNQRLDGLQNDFEQKLDNLQYSISRLINQQHVHLEEENPEEVCLSDTMVEEHCTLLTEEGNGKEAVEKPKRHSQTISHIIEPHCQCPGHLQPTASSTLS